MCGTWRQVRPVRPIKWCHQTVALLCIFLSCHFPHPWKVCLWEQLQCPAIELDRGLHYSSCAIWIMAAVDFDYLLLFLPSFAGECLFLSWWIETAGMQQAVQLNKAVFSRLGCPCSELCCTLPLIVLPSSWIFKPQIPSSLWTLQRCLLRSSCWLLKLSFGCCICMDALQYNWLTVILCVLYLLLLFLPGEIVVGKRSSVRNWCCSRVPLKSPPLYNISYVLSRDEEVRAEKEISEVGWDAFGWSCGIWEARCREAGLCKCEGDAEGS